MPQTKEEYLEWLQALADHRAGTSEEEPVDPAQIARIQAQVDALGLEAMAGAGQQRLAQTDFSPTAEAMEPMGPTSIGPQGYDASGKWYNQAFEAAGKARENLHGSLSSPGIPSEILAQYHEAGIPLADLPQAGPTSGFVPEMIGDALLSYGQTALNPERMSQEQPLDFAFNAMDFIPMGAAAGLVGDVVKGAKKAPLPPIASQARRAMAEVGDLAHAGKRVGWTPQPRGTYSDNLVARASKDGPPGVKTKKHVDKLVGEYADRVQYAMDQGVPMDWFYKDGAELNAAMTKDPEKALIFAKLNGIWSANENVATQYNNAVRGFEEAARGRPIGVATGDINIGQFPVDQGRRANEVIKSGGAYELPPKTDPFASALSGAPGTLEGEGVNDFWEMLSMGWKRHWNPKAKKGEGAWENPVPTKSQHDWMQGIRAEVVAELKDRGEDISRIQAQEMNWAATREQIGSRGDVGGIDKSTGQARYPLPGQPGAGEDSILDSLPKNRAQHSFETAPGDAVQKALPKHFPGYADLSDAEKAQIHTYMQDALIDPETGRDRLVDAMSGDFSLQEPALTDSPGMYTPKDKPGTVEFNPGTQSRSQVGLQGGVRGSVTPESMARLESTEHSRATALGQEAGAASAFIPSGPSTPLKNQNAVRISLGRPGTQQDLLTLNQDFGFVDILPTEDGVVVNRAWDDSNRQWSRESVAREAEIAEALDAPAVMESGSRSSAFEEPDWATGQTPGGGAFASMLAKLDDAGFAHRADSVETKAVIGRIADAFEQAAGIGGGADPLLIETLRAWESGGLAALRKLVKAGTAPAALLAIMDSFEEPR